MRATNRATNEVAISTLHGIPSTTDLLIRPFVRTLQVLVSLAFMGILAFFHLWWWVPVPVLIIELGVEWFFWGRRDSATRLHLEEGRLRLVDPVRDQELIVEASEVRGLLVGTRKLTASRTEAIVVLTGEDRPLLGVRLDCSRWPANPLDVNLEAMAAVIGGNPGILRALAPHDRIGRQLFTDSPARLAKWLDTWVTPEARERVLVQCWSGREPEMDILGLHQELADSYLTLEGETWQVVTPSGRETGSVVGLTSQRTERSAILLTLLAERDPDASAPTTGKTELPMVVLSLPDGPRLAFSSTLAGRLGEPVELDDTTLHLHLAGGAFLAWHLARVLPAGAVPPSLLEAIGDARTALTELPPPLARHLPSD